jgi:hypothetical protein
MLVLLQIVSCLGSVILTCGGCVSSANPTVTWVDEPPGMISKADVRMCNSGAQGARSNLLTRQPQALSVPGLRGLDRFDGESLGQLIDRKFGFRPVKTVVERSRRVRIA